MNSQSKIRFLAGIISLLTLILITLGAFVRATGAGLACPDWPLCFGRAIPDFSIVGVPQEVIHRYLASFVSLLTFIFSYFTYKTRHEFPRLWKTTIGILVLLATQVVMGGLTVLLRLKPFIITTHLLLGTLFLLVFALIALEQPSDSLEEGPPNKGFSRLLGFTVLLVLAQIIIGGFVGSSGAALVCPDFPLCLGEFFPSLGSQQLQMFHRVLAFALFFSVLAVLILGRKTPGLPQKRKGHMFGMTFLVLVQIGIGIGNIVSRVAIGNALAHLIVAEILLLGLVWFYKDLHPNMRIFGGSRG